MLKVCVIGCGGIAQVHGPALRALEGVEKIGVKYYDEAGN